MPSTAFSPTTCWVFFFFSTPEVFIPSIGNGHCKSHHSTAHNFHNAISMRFIECFLSAKRHTHVAPSSESLALSSFPPTNTHNILVPPCVCVWVCSVSSCCHFVAYFCARSSANWIYALQAMGKTLAKSWAGSCIDFVMSRWRRGRGRGRVTGRGDRARGHRRVHGLCTLDAHKILSFWHHINCSSHKFPCILHSPGLWESRTELRGWS